jgi:hypothetical protein
MSYQLYFFLLIIIALIVTGQHQLLYSRLYYFKLYFVTNKIDITI